MSPTYASGKICYLEIPATDIQASATFYSEIFGWKLRTDNGGHTSFDDTVGEVSGTWVTDRPPMREAGIIISIMVDDAEACMTRLEAAGTEIVRPLEHDPETIAWFRDPGGNVMGIYQEPSMA